MCVATEARPLDRLGQLGEFEQDSNTASDLESNTDSHSAQSKAHVARQAAAERGEEAPHSKEQSKQQQQNPEGPDRNNAQTVQPVATPQTLELPVSMCVLQQRQGLSTGLASSVSMCACESPEQKFPSAIAVMSRCVLHVP